MNTPFYPIYDVIIAGAGPVGLLLACELRLGGCSVLVLEKAPDPCSRLKSLPFGLRGLTVPTIDSLDRRDLLDALTTRSARREVAAAAPWTQQPRRPGGHFAGLQFFHDRIDDAAWPFRLPGSVSGLATDMASIEDVLAGRAAAAGVHIARGRAFESFVSTSEGLAVRAGGDTVQGSWLVGCDGGRSAVRKAAGIGFTGTAPEFTGYSVQAVLADSNRLQPGRHHTATGMYTFAAPGTIAMVDFDGGACHRAGPITRGHVEAVLQRLSGMDVSVLALELATTWTDRAYQATEYRRDRVLLAGDAAHTHSPLGGQGLNLGLGDAVNLGWKLAATIRGDAPPDLLDSYDRERQPIAAQVLDWSRAQVAAMRPDPGSRALAAIIRDLLETEDGATYFAGRAWGVGLRYDLGDGPLVGRSAPNFELTGGSTSNDHLRTGQGLLLDFSEDPSLRALAGLWERRIKYVSADTENRLGTRALLIRPDGVVVWTSGPDTVSEGAAQAAWRWFGQPQG